MREKSLAFLAKLTQTSPSPSLWLLSFLALKDVPPDPFLQTSPGGPGMQTGRPGDAVAHSPLPPA
jgi:hypothetical protein